MPLGEYSAGK